MKPSKGLDSTIAACRTRSSRDDLPCLRHQWAGTAGAATRKEVPMYASFRMQTPAAA